MLVQIQRKMYAYSLSPNCSTLAALIDPSSQTHYNTSNRYDDTSSLYNMFFIVIRTLPVFVRVKTGL